MKNPKDQAEFYKLLSKLLYYLVSGQSNVGFLTAQNWNKYYRRAVLGLKVSKAVDAADCQTPPIYECIVIRPGDEETETLTENVWDAEGILDGVLLHYKQTYVDESMTDDSRSVVSSGQGTYGGSPAGSHNSFDSRGGSPMAIDEP